MAIKKLEAMIDTIRDNDSLILGVKGDSIRTIEFSICSACFSTAKSQSLIQWSLCEWLLVELDCGYDANENMNELIQIQSNPNAIHQSISPSPPMKICLSFLLVIALMLTLMMIVTMNQMASILIFKFKFIM